VLCVAVPQEEFHDNFFLLLGWQAMLSKASDVAPFISTAQEPEA
jgi:hypothetical protein